MEQVDDIKTVDVRFGMDEAGCAGTAVCTRMVSRNRERLCGRYISTGEITNDQVLAAVLDLRQLSYEDYTQCVKKLSNGENIRQARRATKKEYYCKPFVRSLFVPDIVEINQSKESRSGGRMKDSYLRGVEEMGGYPAERHVFSLPPCPIHYDIWWGIFRKEPGYRQGEIETGEQLLGYIDLRRIGNYGLYSYIIGHGDYLRDGIMYELHLSVIRWLLDPENPYGRGFEYLIYAGYNQGGKGLQHWKRKFGYQGAYLQSSDLIPQRQSSLLGRLFGYFRHVSD